MAFYTGLTRGRPRISPRKKRELREERHRLEKEAWKRYVRERDKLLQE